MNRNDWNPYEDQECIDAFLEARQSQVEEWQEERVSLGMAFSDPIDYIYLHDHAFDDFAYNYYEDRLDSEADKIGKELKENR